MANVGIGTAAQTGNSLGAVVKSNIGVALPIPKTGQIWPRGSKTSAG